MNAVGRCPKVHNNEKRLGSKPLFRWGIRSQHCGVGFTNLTLQQFVLSLTVLKHRLPPPNYPAQSTQTRHFFFVFRLSLIPSSFTLVLSFSPTFFFLSYKSRLAVLELCFLYLVCFFRISRSSAIPWIHYWINARLYLFYWRGVYC